MELKKIVSRVEPTSFGFNSKFFVNNDEEALSLANTEEPAKKRGRPPSKKRIDDGSGEYVAVEGRAELSPIDGNISYRKTYEDTTNMLAASINQIDGLSANIQADLHLVRASKTLKNKYNYLCDLTGAAAGLVGNKISAIREINSVITNCHNLDMKRVKEFKLNDKDDDDKKIMDMYNAFINTPVGSVQGMGMPFGGITPMQINSPTMGMVGIGIDNDIKPISGEPGYENYLRNITPEQNAMSMENNPFIKAVVIYNQETQDKYFDIMDTSTGQSVPNVPRPADFLLQQMRIDVRSGVARNTSANMDFPLVLIGNRAIDEY